MAERLLKISGVLVVLFGIVDLIWTQVDTNFPDEANGRISTTTRLQIATGPVFVIGIGLVVIAAAYLLGAVMDRTSN